MTIGAGLAEPKAIKPSDGRLWCVQGLSPEGGEDPLSAPEEEQVWSTRYHAFSHAEGLQYLRKVLSTWDEPEHERYLDWRLRPPLVKAAREAVPVTVASGSAKKSKR